MGRDWSPSSRPIARGRDDRYSPVRAANTQARPRILSVEELDTGLRLLGRGDMDQNAFWDENVASFRMTVLFAIRETSDALLSPKITPYWRTLLQRQLESLVHYIELSDRYIARRRISARTQHASKLQLVQAAGAKRLVH